MITFSPSELRRSYQLRHEPEEYARAAHGAWTIILAVAALVLLLSVVFGAWQFFAPQEPLITESAGGGISGFDRKQLSAVVDFYAKRRATFEGMMSEE